MEPGLDLTQRSSASNARIASQKQQNSAFLGSYGAYQQLLQQPKPPAPSPTWEFPWGDLIPYKNKFRAKTKIPVKRN
jgi:hypothetical protein